MRYDAILFDLDNTLIDRVGALQRYLERSGLDPASCAALGELDNLGYTPRAEFCEAAVQRFPALADSPEAFWSDFSAGLVQAVEPVDSISSAVGRLADASYMLGVISNGAGPRQRAKLRRAGLQQWFAHDRIIISEEEGVSKPDVRIFERALSRWSRKSAEQVLFVGDDPVADIAGARAAGLATCWIANGRSKPDDLDATIVVDSVEQLAELLQAFGSND